MGIGVIEVVKDNTAIKYEGNEQNSYYLIA